MGYYTNHDVIVTNLKDERDAVYFQHKFDEICGYSQQSKDTRVSAKDGTYTYKFYVGEAKWYDHDEQLTKMSIIFPDVLIEVHGEGEENGDVWKSRYLNGKSETVRAEMIFPDFKEIV